MKIICSKPELLKGVSIVSKAVPSRTTMPILECILIDASTDIIKLTGNDMELGIETTIDGEILKQGTIAVDAKLLSEIVRKLPDNEITMEVDSDMQLIIACENAKFKISVKSGRDFSYLPTIEKKDSINVSEFTLKEIIRQTIFSIGDNESNKMMSGVLFEIKGDTLKLASLDGHRISIRKIKLGSNYQDRRIVVPGKTLIEISKILTGEQENMVTLYFTTNHILFEFSNTKVVSRLLEGEFFNIDQMVSSDYSTKISVNKKEFLSCIDRTTLMIKEGDKKPIIINLLDKKMEIKITSQMGSLDEEIFIHKEGKDLQIGFNPRFLIDALKVIDEEEVTLYFMNAKAPCFIRDMQESYNYLILPINFIANN